MSCDYRTKCGRLMRTAVFLAAIGGKSGKEGLKKISELTKNCKGCRVKGK